MYQWRTQYNTENGSIFIYFLTSKLVNVFRKNTIWRRLCARLDFCRKPITAQKMTFSIKDFFCKCNQIRMKLKIASHLLNKSLMEKFIFCAVNICKCLKLINKVSGGRKNTRMDQTASPDTRIIFLLQDILRIYSLFKIFLSCFILSFDIAPCSRCIWFTNPSDTEGFD